MCSAKETYRVAFSLGAIMGGIIYGGIYETSNPDEQAAIEAHEDFKSGMIFLLNKKEESHAKKEVKGVTNGQSAIEYLKKQGYSEDEIGSQPSQIALFAKEKNISFPDWLTFNKL